MRDQLKEYVDQHRTELDVAVPSDKLWTNIENAMIITIPAAGITSGIPWLKYFAFGLSSVAGAAMVYTVLTDSSSQPEAISSIPAPVQTILMNEPATNEPQINASPKTPAAEFTFVNAAVPLPPQNDIPLALQFTGPASENMLPQQTEPVNAVEAAATISTNDSVFTGIKRVEVVSSLVTVNVQGSTGNAVSTIHKSGEGDNMKIEYKRTDTLLQISVVVECDEDKEDKEGRKFGRKNKCESHSGGNVEDAELTVYLPSGTSVVVENTYGDTRITSVTGAVCEVRTSSGDVHLTSVNAYTNVVTSYGDLAAHNINGNFTARLSSGSAVVDDVHGDVDVVSTYGDQQYTDITGNLQANGSTGNIRITKLSGDIAANTTYGDIQVTNTKGSARLTTSSGNIVGENVELTGNSTFVTSYGDVEMTLLNPLETLSFDLVTTYGDILVDKNGEQFRNDNKLSLTRGNILVKATSSSGSQVFR